MTKTLARNKTCRIRYASKERQIVVQEGRSVLMEIPRERALALAHRIIEVLR
jgi:hypothetical protein